MKNMTHFVAAAALATVSMTSSAWWGSPYGYNGFYAPVAPITKEQQKAMAEQQTKAMQDAVAAQRKYAEQFVGNRPENFRVPFARRSFEAPADIAARRDEMRKQMEARHAEMMKRVAEQRAFAQSGRVHQVPADIAARRDQMQRQAEAHRAEMTKRSEERQAFVRADRAYQVPAYITARRDEMQKQADEQRKVAEEQQAAMRNAMEERRQNREITSR